MALFTSILPGFPGKLPFMLILVAIDATGKFDFELSLFPGRHMTTCAGHLLMGKFDGVPSRSMIRYGKRGRAPSLHRVATDALSPIRPLCKLAAMRIRIVTVLAGVVSNRNFEIRSLVAGHAVDLDVLALQRKGCLRMIESACKPRSLPRDCRMARVAAGLEFALVRVRVAIRAGCKRDPLIARLAVVPRGVALLAIYLFMCAQQGKTRLGVVEAILL